MGFGGDCVSGGEVQAALDAGITADKIVFAGVGKADWEINLGIDQGDFCFNVESLRSWKSSMNLLPKKQNSQSSFAHQSG